MIAQHPVGLGPEPAATEPARAGRLPAVCFVAPQAYGALSGRDDIEQGGGAERQQVLLAEELVRRGHRVSFVVLDHGQPRRERIRGLDVIACYRRERGWPGVRFFHPRLSGLWRAMRDADADVYYQRCASAQTGLVALWCRRRGRGFLFAAASDTDCTAALPLLTRFADRALYRYGLRAAHSVIAQTSHQQRMLRADFALEASIVPSGFSGIEPGPPREASPAGAPAGGVLWVGRLSPEKRPDWVVRLATALPEERFDVVGPCGSDAAFGHQVAAQIAALPNVRWHGHVPHRALPEIYRAARLLICTSPAEGFPNVFLEAWSSGRGVLSTVDPEGVIGRFGTGRVARTLDEMTRHLSTSARDRAFWHAAGQRGRRYVQRHHTVQASAHALTALIEHAHAAAHAAAGRGGTTVGGTA